jgi:hypothetical protein
MLRRLSRPIAIPVPAETLVKMYNDGQSHSQIATAIGVSVSTVRRVLQREKVKPRLGAYRKDKVGYIASHNRVKRLFGRATCCTECGSADESKKYDWANLTGNYEDPSDYRQMCKSCHRRYDFLRRREIGRRTSPRQYPGSAGIAIGDGDYTPIPRPKVFTGIRAWEKKRLQEANLWSEN